MAGFSTETTDHMIRANLYSAMIREPLLDELMGMTYVEMLSDFPDGDTWNVPSLGQAEVSNYEEGQAIRFTAMDTGNFTFTLSDYIHSGTYITNKMKQDSMWADKIMAKFVPSQQRAIMKRIELDVLAVGPNGQTPADPNTINGAKHRFVGSGTGDTLTIDDFAKARYALKKANVGDSNLVAIVSPEVDFTFSTLTNISNMSYNPMWEGIVTSGISTGMKFTRNIHGFDVYVSNNLKDGIAETIDGNAITNGVANLFFSAQSDYLPFIGAMRQNPTVESKYNIDLQREEFVTICRYGFKLSHPDNLVVVLADNSQVYA